MSGTNTPDSATPESDPPLADASEPSSRILSEKVTVYSSRSEIRSPAILLMAIYTGFMDGRGIAWRLFLRNLRGMYRQTVLGLFWAFLPPIANTAMWIFLKSQKVFSIDDTGVDGTVYILTGMILWQAFIDAFQMPADKMRSNKNMLSRITFPRESLLLVGIGEVFFNLAIRLVLLVPAFIIFSVPLNWSILLAPFAIIGLVFVGLGLGLLIMPIGSLYQDVGRFLAMMIPFWMIITPIIYVPFSGTQGFILNCLNPASPLLITARDLLLVGGSAHWQIGLGYGLVSIPLVLLGLVVFRVSLPVLIERMQA